MLNGGKFPIFLMKSITSMIDRNTHWCKHCANWKKYTALQADLIYITTSSSARLVIKVINFQPVGCKFGLAVHQLFFQLSSITNTQISEAKRWLHWLVCGELYWHYWFELCRKVCSFFLTTHINCKLWFQM